jgi:hypothetical protein
MNDNEFSLKGKNIVLTGAIGYLGSKYAEGLSKFGANVILADINLRIVFDTLSDSLFWFCGFKGATPISSGSVSATLVSTPLSL